MFGLGLGLGFSRDHVDGGPKNNGDQSTNFAVSQAKSRGRELTRTEPTRS
jgi:hypothetical protein